MSLVAEKQLEQIGKTAGCEHHDYDLVHELDIRLNFLWRCDQYIANADGKADLQNMWRELKRQEQSNIQRIKDCIADEVQQGCF